MLERNISSAFRGVRNDITALTACFALFCHEINSVFTVSNYYVNFNRNASFFFLSIKRVDCAIKPNTWNRCKDFWQIAILIKQTPIFGRWMWDLHCFYRIVFTGKSRLANVLDVTRPILSPGINEKHIASLRVRRRSWNRTAPKTARTRVRRGERNGNGTTGTRGHHPSLRPGLKLKPTGLVLGALRYVRRRL